MPRRAAPTNTAVPLQAMTSVNPFAHRLSHDQGQLRSPVSEILTIGGQGPVDAEGRLLHEGDAAAQLDLALTNLTAVVGAAGMTLADVAHLRIYTTDMVALLDVQFVVTEHFADEAATPPVTMIEVARLAVPGMDVEIDGLAVRTARPGDVDEVPPDRPSPRTVPPQLSTSSHQGVIP